MSESRTAAQPPHDASALRRALRPRLEVVAWEIEEVRRKKGWDNRHEHSGPEQTAWLRLPTRLDGRTYQGGPP